MSPSQQGGSQQGQQQSATVQMGTALSKALNINIDALAKANPSAEHNLREAWDSTCNTVQEFYNKYGSAGARQ